MQEPLQIPLSGGCSRFREFEITSFPVPEISGSEVSPVVTAINPCSGGIASGSLSEGRPSQQCLKFQFVFAAIDRVDQLDNAVVMHNLEKTSSARNDIRIEH